MLLNQRKLHARTLVDQWIKSEFPSSGKLVDQDLAGFGDFAAGWNIPCAIGGVTSQSILIDHDFPYSVPRVFIKGSEESLNWPHVEKVGRLCLAGDAAAIATADPVAVVATVLHEANSLLNSNAHGKNTEDFREDFGAYWRRSLKENAPTIRHTTFTSPKSKAISAWHGLDSLFVGNSSEELKRWMNNRYGDDPNRTFSSAAFVRLEQLPAPSDYPSSVVQLRQLVSKYSNDGLPILDALLKGQPSKAAVILCFPTSDIDRSTFSVVLNIPPRVKIGKRNGGRPYERGFRKGKVPASHIACYYLLDKAKLENLDRGNSRLDKEALNILKDKHVTLIGVGSLGASVAVLLAKSGVKNLHLIDPDIIGWENICRHDLGAGFVGKNKAEALSQSIVKQLPSIHQCSYSKSGWLSVYDKNNKLFEGTDLVISMTGCWNSESALSDLQSSGELKAAVLYGWMEANALAAHALLLEPGGACLRCGFDKTGAHNIPATLQRIKQNQLCGGGASTYGAVELSNAAALVSRLALDKLTNNTASTVWRTWFGSADQLYSEEGMWNPLWTSTFGDPSRGGSLSAQNWEQRKDCECNS